MNSKNVLLIVAASLIYVFNFGYAYSQTINDSIRIEIKTLNGPLNSPFADYSPVISADGKVMLFTSKKPTNEKDIKKKRESFENVYISEFDSTKGEWKDGVLLGPTVNEPFRNNAVISLSNDGQTLLLYRDDDYGNGDIFQSTLEGKNWTEAVKLPSPINSEDHESSASLSPDGKTIYFVSTRPGGKGGRDIYSSTKDKNGKWQKAVNLGAVINTNLDEAPVFIYPDGKTLYFSSKGHKSKGGYDVYKSTLEAGKWTKPVNLGTPINTPDDDLFFVLRADGKTGYYASAKEGGKGEKDIYEINFISLKTAIKSGPKLTLFTGLVIDKANSSPIGSNITIIDNEKNEVVSEIKSNSSTGKFLISLPSGKNYGISVKKDGYLFYSDNFTLPDTAEYKEVVKTIPLEKIVIGSKIVLKNIFYDFDKSTLRPESMNELANLIQVLKDNASIKIELSSHTDSKGSDEYNLSLSQSRAQTVVDFIVSKGIAQERMKAKGYGETKPIGSNDTEEGRQMNRRTEFEIISN